MSTVNMKNIGINEIEDDKSVFSKLARRIAPGDVYWCNLGDLHDQYNKYMIKKVRPCIILSEDSDDMKKDVFTCLPIKSYKGDDYENNYFVTKKINLGDVDSILCLDQMRPINRRSIFEYVGTLTPPQKDVVDGYIEEYLKMNCKFREIKRIMKDNNLTPEDVIQIILSTLGDNRDATPSGQSCAPFELPKINLT